ncbi:folate family ECF transporter S component [Eremococcus coleocola]|uniref:Folate transporter FolT n=1 Tax=Eremococcus coleocola ACS-139-V-Col8 TaxID=908337 RepID=E4KPC7_9LACT|nr:folate family ECF transporter S component [Eremococcus coleocola]EFR31149.1 hypothetical protein HMPREF9257_1414 [Eremococcus coleocola ACS-139-V-Col8]
MNNKIDQMSSHRSAFRVSLLGIILGLRLVLGFLPSLNFGNQIQIGFGFIGAALSGILFGPWYALIVSVAADIISSLLRGDNFFLGFTLSAALGGLFYGYFLWRKPRSLGQIMLAVGLVSLLINVGLNSIWLHIMYDKAIFALLPIRIFKNMISFFVNSFVLYYLFNLPSIKHLIDKYQF